MIVDFPVADRRYGLVLIEKGLLAVCLIDDGEAADAEGNVVAIMRAESIRPAMLDGRPHGLEVFGIAVFPEPAVNPAHANFSG